MIYKNNQMRQYLRRIYADGYDAAYTIKKADLDFLAKSLLTTQCYPVRATQLDY